MNKSYWYILTLALYSISILLLLFFSFTMCNCIRLTKTCHIQIIALLWVLIASIVLICKSL